MNAEKERFLYHLECDPHLRFFLWQQNGWKEMISSEVRPDTVRSAKKGVVTYPSGEILSAFGNPAPAQLPNGLRYLEGPLYKDDLPGYRLLDALRGWGRVTIVHGPSSIFQRSGI